MKLAALALSLYAALVVSAGAARAQTTPPPAGPPAAGGNQEAAEDEVVRVATTLVTVPLSVVDRDGRYLTGLRREDFRVYEEGVEQEIAFFNSTDQPIFVVLLLDTSGSMAQSLPALKEAAAAFVRQLRPQDTALPVSFDSRIHTPLRAPTGDQRLLAEAIHSLRPAAGAFSGTGLYDAVDFVNRRLFKPNSRNALILFTDGGDTGSGATRRGTLYGAAEVNALVYTVYYDPLDLGPTAKLQRVSRPDRSYIRALAERTGGRFFEPKDPEKVSRTMAAIADELRRQYSLGYYPKERGPAEQQRRIKVRVNLPRAAVRARDSYVYRPPVGR
jgi:Ca-activated chloride channel homolog